MLPAPRGSSALTSRQVPLTTGVQLTAPWPALPPGSSISMTNFVPLDGAIQPRSRLSSLNTLRTLTPSVSGLVGIAELQPATFGTKPDWWLSSATQYGVIASNGSISRASFVSTSALTEPAITVVQTQFAPMFSSEIEENMLVVASVRAGPSADSLLCLYHQNGAFANKPLFSYVTGAPRAISVTAFDNYLIAWNIRLAPTRAQWCVRGDPFNWSGEGSGFEDLLAMSGQGTVIRGMPDGRLILFSTTETWYGVTAAYPAQFQFFPLEKHVGCPFPLTVAQTDQGLLYLGSDLQLRLLPTGGGASQVAVPSLSPVLRSQALDSTTESAWGVYDPYRRRYYLFVNRVSTSTPKTGVVVDLATGAWSYLDMTAIDPVMGMSHAADRLTDVVTSEGMLLLSTYTVYSLNSTLATDSGSAVTATWRSAPLATDLPGDYKQLTEVYLDYRATSRATVTLKVSADGGNTYETTGRTVSLASAPVAGRAKAEMYLGGAYPAIELTSTSTGFSLHRLDATLNVGGRV